MINFTQRISLHFIKHMISDFTYFINHDEEVLGDFV